MENEEEIPLLEHEEKKMTTTTTATQPILSNLEEHQHQGTQEKEFQ